MAISIDPLTYVIYVPKADLTLVQASPEIRALNVNQFRLWLKDYEDDPDYGIYLYKTHNHNTEVTLSGLTYARIVEVLAPYTVEFEDGQYTVNCSGANHNLADRKVANQVSLIINNAAGLITNASIEFASFNGGVTLDVDNVTGKAQSGTVFPSGTPQQPVDNVADALLIASVRGFSTIYVVGDLTLTTGDDVAGYIFEGESAGRSLITVETGAVVTNCEFYECTLTGVLDGNAKVKNCQINNLEYISGFIELCVLAGEITLGGGAAAYFLDCWAGTLLGAPPVIDIGGSGQTLVMQNFNGYIQWKNMTGASDQANASLNAGWVLLDSTISNGLVNIIGTGIVEDYSTGATVNTHYLVNNHALLEEIMDNEELEDGITLREAIQVMLATLVGKASGGGGSTITFRNTADDANRVVMTVDDNGNRSSVVLNT